MIRGRLLGVARFELKFTQAGRVGNYSPGNLETLFFQEGATFSGKLHLRYVVRPPGVLMSAR